MKKVYRGFIAHVEETITTYKILVRKPEGREVFERPGMKGSIKKDNYCFMGSEALYSCRLLPTFWRNFLPSYCYGRREDGGGTFLQNVGNDQTTRRHNPNG
jgi:hypothetical protein